jgi:hypothetical protein
VFVFADWPVFFDNMKEWVTDNPFIISPRITFEVSVRLLGGLMALGYTIAAILKRSSRVFSDGKATVKIDWLEQLSRRYIQVRIVSDVSCCSFCRYDFNMIFFAHG